MLGLVLLFRCRLRGKFFCQPASCQAAKAVNQQSAGSHILIAYYSHTGTTRKEQLRKIHQLVGGDLVELQPEKPYPADHQEHLQMVIKGN